MDTDLAATDQLQHIDNEEEEIMAQTSPKAEFFSLGTFALVGNSDGRRFPKLSRRYLEGHGKTVYAVDLAGGTEPGTLSSLQDLPSGVEAAIIEVDEDSTKEVLQQVIDAGIQRIWLHQGTDIPEAQDLCEQAGSELHTGGCAVMYLAPTASPHALHRGLWKLIGKY